MKFLQFKKKNYLDYLKTLDIDSLQNEYLEVKYGTKEVIDRLNWLLDRIEFNFLNKLIDENYYNSLLIKKFLYMKLFELKADLFNKDIKNIEIDNYILNDEEKSYSKDQLINQISNYYNIFFQKNVMTKELNKRFDYKKNNLSYYIRYEELTEKLSKQIDKYKEILENKKYKDISKFIDQVIKTITNIAEKYSDRYFNLDYIYKKIFTKEQYDVLNKYNCFNKFTYALKNISVININLDDLKNMFNGTVITKIIDGDLEFNVSNKVSNKMFYIRFYSDESLELEEVDRSIQYYYEKYNLNIEELFLSLQQGLDKEFVIFLSNDISK